MINRIQLFLIILLFLIPLTSSTSTFKFVFNIFRHGARSPYTGLINGTDCYNNKWDSLGELTPVGKRMHYLLGYRNRLRYITNTTSPFLSPTPSIQELLIYSTDVNRTIESVYSLLQGLYPPSTGPFIPSTVNLSDTRPHKSNYTDNFTEIESSFSNNASLPNLLSLIPVHILDKSLHTSQLHEYKNCPGIESAYINSMNRPEMKTFMKKMTDLYGKQLQQIEGTSNETFLYDYWTLYKYMDTFIVDKTNGNDLSILESHNINLNEFEKNAFEFLNLDYLGTNFNNKEIGVLSMTHPMRKVLYYMKQVVKGKPSPKMLMYSAHDSTIGAFEVFNNVVFGTQIEYAYFAENCAYELYEEDGNMKVRYIKGDNVKFEISYQEFKEKVEKALWTDKEIENYCKWKGDKLKWENVFRMIVMISGILAIVLGSVLFGMSLFVIKNKKSYKQQDKSDITNYMLDENIGPLGTV